MTPDPLPRYWRRIRSLRPGQLVPQWLPGSVPPGAVAGGAAVVAVLTAVTLLAAVAAGSGGQTRVIWATAGGGATNGPTPTADPTPTANRWQPPRPRAVEPEPVPPTGWIPDPRQPPPAPNDPLPPADFIGWAVLDRTTGAITGSDTLAATSTTASMIKAWLVADYLRLTAEADEEPSDEKLQQLSLIIRDSHNGYTQTLFQEDLGGGTASIDRLIAICGLTDSSPVSDWWSNTRLSARDTARMGACLADGRAAGPGRWTNWLLDEMRLVRGVGDFGIRHAFPAGQQGMIAIKNGWVIRDDGSWHVNCLAIGDTWSMGVLTRYPADLGYDQMGHLIGGEICQILAARHLPGAG